MAALLCAKMLMHSSLVSEVSQVWGCGVDCKGDTAIGQCLSADEY